MEWFLMEDQSTQLQKKTCCTYVMWQGDLCKLSSFSWINSFAKSIS